MPGLAQTTIPPPAQDNVVPRNIRELVVVQRGTLPILLVIPHGGRAQVPGVPARLGGPNTFQFLTAQDDGTAELGEIASRILERRLGKRPYAVVAGFDRKYIDANRAPRSSYESELAKLYYDAFHKAITEYCCARSKTNRRGGLLLDIHGQPAYPESLLRGSLNGKSVSLLTARFGQDALTGPKSVFGVMDQAGYPVLPKLGSQDREIAAYSGGYIVEEHGAQRPDGIDALQMEFGSIYRFPPEVIPTTGEDLALAIETFCRAFYPQSLSTTPPAPTKPTPKKKPAR